jgi:N-carbamoyl-L-amino-acid hydrolase
LFGSHIDSVPGGGNFDGDLGSIAAIEVIHTLREHKVTARHPLRIYIWQNEEGGLIGSTAAAGDSLDFARQFNETRLADGIRKTRKYSTGPNCTRFFLLLPGAAH